MLLGNCAWVASGGQFMACSHWNPLTWVTPLAYRHTGTTFLARSISLSMSCQNLTLLYVPGMHSIQQAGGPPDYKLMWLPLWVLLYRCQRTSGPPRWCCGKEYVCQCRWHKSCGFDPWVEKIPWSRKWQPTPVFLPGKFTDRGNWKAPVHGAKSWIRLTTHTHTHTHTRGPHCPWLLSSHFLRLPGPLFL